MSNGFVESNDYLAGPGGQRTSMPPKAPAHPMGNFAPRPVGSIVATAPDNRWLANEDATGQGGKPSGGSMPSVVSHSAPPPKGVSQDEVHLPSPGGQY